MKDSQESRVSTTAHNTLPPCNSHNYNSELPLYNKVCRTKIPVHSKKKRKRKNVGMTRPLPQEYWSSGFSDGEKDTKNNRLTYSVNSIIWVAHIMKPFFIVVKRLSISCCKVVKK